MPDPDDTRLLQTFCASRDEDAFTRLVRRHLPLVRSVALRRLGSATLAEDAAQNVFILLARKAAAVARHPERLAAWLHRTAFLEASNLARSEARFARIPAAPPEEASPPAAMNRPEIFEKLDAALQALPETDRELLLRRYWKGEDFRTISAALGRSVESCTKRVERSLTKLGACLGGAVPAAVAAASLTAMKPSASAAMPTVERIAQAALHRAGSAAGSAGGILTGNVLAASAAALLLGWWASSPSADTAPGPARSRTQPQDSTFPLAAARPLPPRESGPRPALQEVLASIDAGRWGPLVAFLADATPAELRVMLEDRLTYDSYYWEPHPDADYEDYPGHLMLRRWTEMDSEGALQWSHGVQLGGKAATALVFEEWFKFAPDAATAAFAGLTDAQQREVATRLSYGEAKPRDVLLTAFPKLRWSLSSSSFQHRNEDDPAAAMVIINQALDGKLHPDRDLSKVTQAFSVLARTDPQSALEQAARLPADPARTAALAAVRNTVPPPANAVQPDASVPRSWDRAILARRMTLALALDEPDTAAAQVKAMAPGTERDAAVASLVSRWSGTDPWRLLDVLASLRDRVACGTDSVPLRGFPDSGGMGINAHAEPDYYTGHALYAAALEDPRRALVHIPQLAALFTKRGRTGSAHAWVQIYLGRVLNGWVFKDRDGAAAWLAAMPEEHRRAVLDGFQHQFTLTPEALRFLQSQPR